MISAGWVLYALGLSALAGAAAVAAEAACRSRGVAARWVWVVATTASVAVPVGVAVVVGTSVRVVVPSPSGDRAAVSGAAGLAGRSVAGPTAPPAAEVVPVEALRAAARLLRRDIDAVALPLWIFGSAAVLLFGAAGWARMRLRRRGWRERRLHGVPVAVSSSDGPAAVGVFRGRIVLPAWALALPRRMTRLILLHEGEHLRRRDTLLLGWSGVLLAAMPWNPILWWQCRRVAVAVELDCDRRVASRCRDRRRYAEVLVEMAVRGRRAPALATGLGPGALERRIRALIEGGDAGSARVAVGAALAAVAIVVACETPLPQAPVADGDGGPAAAVVHESPRLRERAPLRERMRQVAADPDVRDLRGSIALTIQVDAAGRPSEVRVDVTVARSPDGPGMVERATEIARAVRVEPALRDGRPVPSEVPLWVVFGDAGVEASLVDPVEYAREAEGDIPDRLRPDLNLIRRLEGLR